MLEFRSNRIGGHATAQRERSEDTYCTEQERGWDRPPCHYSRASSWNQRLTTFAATKIHLPHSKLFSRGKQYLLPMISISLETFPSMSHCKETFILSSFEATIASLGMQNQAQPKPFLLFSIKLLTEGYVRWGQVTHFWRSEQQIDNR